MKKVREFPAGQPQNKQEEQFFVFCDKHTGVVQFRAQSNDPQYAIERVAGLVAMQCLVRGHNPDDFVVLVPAERSVAQELIARASELLEEGRAVANPASLSPRQKEILHSVIRNHANKEIASRLNITVRTVKFHISALLAKFNVQNRTELARRAAALLQTGIPEALLPMPEAVANAATSHAAGFGPSRSGRLETLRPKAALRAS